jgi:molybdenum-dependent DNA-binding transcriptional regulator ModE
VDWDDLKILLAVSRKRSARGAAQELGISNSTVTRRLDELERSLGTRLFDRTPEGYRITQSAENLLPTAEHVEDLLLAAERQITGVDQELQGTDPAHAAARHTAVACSCHDWRSLPRITRASSSISSPAPRPWTSGAARRTSPSACSARRTSPPESLDRDAGSRR